MPGKAMIPEEVQDGDQYIVSSLHRSAKDGLELNSKKSLEPWVELRFCLMLGTTWLQHGFQHLTMLFYQQELKSYTDNLKPITSDSLYIHL